MFLVILTLLAFKKRGLVEISWPSIPPPPAQQNFVPPFVTLIPPHLKIHCDALAQNAQCSLPMSPHLSLEIHQCRLDHNAYHQLPPILAASVLRSNSTSTIHLFLSDRRHQT